MNVYLGSTEVGNLLGSTELDGIYLGEDEVWTSTPLPNYLCFTANTAWSTIKLAKNGSPTVVTLETSTDGRTWSTYTFGDTITLANIGDKVYRRNTSETDTGFSKSDTNYYNFSMTGSIAGSGDINFLLNKNSTTILSGYCYTYMFQNCTGLTSAPMLPAATLAACCYSYMFSGCTGLTSTPVLPATTLAMSCYQYMFYQCTSLTTVPELPATTLSDYCYAYMFQNCTGLTSAPALPATTLTSACYRYMFSGCTGLTSTPVLPATTLASNCYRSMFQNCTGLTSIPSLPATTLANYCYNSMFQGCSKIKLSKTQTGEYQTAYRIPTSGTGTVGTSSLNNMFTSTGGTFTGAPTINITYYTSNAVVS